MCPWEAYGFFKLPQDKDEAKSTIITRADYNLLKKAALISHLYAFMANYSAAFAS